MLSLPEKFLFWIEKRERFYVEVLLRSKDLFSKLSMSSSNSVGGGGAQIWSPQTILDYPLPPLAYVTSQYFRRTKYCVDSKGNKHQAVIMGISSPGAYISILFRWKLAKTGQNQFLMCMTKRNCMALLCHFWFGLQQGRLCNSDFSGLKLSVNIANPCSKLLCTEVIGVYKISRKHYYFRLQV